MDQSPEISARFRISLWIGAWVVALAAACVPTCVRDVGVLPIFIMNGWAFPVGVAAFAFPDNDNVSSAVFFSSVAVGWCVYALLTVVGLLQHRRIRFFVVYGILCALLILNAVGCNVNMFKGHM